MKKFLRVSFKVLLFTAAILLFLLSGFRATEHLKGNEFLSYLEDNIVTAPLSESLDFSIMDDDLYHSSLILLGEIHGFQEPTKFDPEFYAYLRKEHQVVHYLVEMDMGQAFFMNKYNETGNEELLDKVLNNWVVVIGQENEDYRLKWQKLRGVYQDVGDFRYYGNNNISDFNLLEEYIEEITGHTLELTEVPSDSLKMIKMSEEIRKLTWPDSLEWEKDFLIQNIEYSLEKKYREEVLTDNLISIYDHFQLENEKVYGYYGLGHTILNSFENGYKAMAARFLEAKPDMDGKVLSANFIFLDSYMTVYNKNQPEFLRGEGKFTEFPVSHDNIWLSYLYGIDELKRLTTPFTKSIVRLNGVDSPYRMSRRLSNMSKILPIGMVLNSEKEKVTTDYYQYLILVRNSAGAIGLEK